MTGDKRIATGRVQVDKPSLGGCLAHAVLDRTFVVTQVRFCFLDACEDLVEESLVLGLLAVLQSRREVALCGRAGQAAAGLNARKRAVWRLDGFVAELLRGLLAPLQQLVVFQLQNAQIKKSSFLSTLESNLLPYHYVLATPYLQCAVLGVHLVKKRDAPLLHCFRPPDAQLLVTSANLLRVGCPQDAVAVTSLPVVLCLLFLLLHVLHLFLLAAGLFLRGKENRVGYQHLVWFNDTGRSRGDHVLERRDPSVGKSNKASV